MLDYQQLDKIWDNGLSDRTVHRKPKILLALHDEEWFYVMSDNKSIVFLLSSNRVGKRGVCKGSFRAFAVPKKYCHIENFDGFEFYDIEIGKIIVVGCNKPFSVYKNQQEMIVQNIND